MPIDDFLDANQEGRRLKKAMQRAWVSGGNAGGDSSHAGSGVNSVQLGVDGTAAGIRSVSVGVIADAGGYAGVAVGDNSAASADYTVAVGHDSEASGAQSVAVGKASGAVAYGAVAVGAASYAQGDQSNALGFGAFTAHESSTAVGTGAVTTADQQVMLGTASDTVVVPGTLSTPSARRLKENVTDAPELVSIFPALYEWQYILGDGRRHIGPMADDLVGTDAERFLIRDAAGEPAAIQVVALLVAQVAQLNARVVALENELKG